jgi:signal transduction histidine kinase/CheY-like chemotaxis protein
VITSTSRSPLAWHHRLDARVVGAIALLVALSLAGVLAATTRTVTTRSFSRASADLEAGRTAFYRLSDDRAEFAAAQAALVTALPVFRAHMTDSRLAEDVATLEAMGEEYRRELKADFCIVADRQGRWTIDPGWPGGASAPAALRASIADASAGRPRRAIAEAGDRLFLIVSQPARFAEEILGSLTVGYALDDAVARRLAEVTHADVNILAGTGLSASSLTGTNRAALARLSTDGALRAFGVQPAIRRVGEARYVVGVFPLSADEAPESIGRLVLLQDWQPTQRFVDEVRRQLLLAGAVIFALAVAGGLVVSRRVSGPLQELASAAGDIAAGNWARRVEVGSRGEVSVLARAFNDMTASLRHWYEEAKHRDDQLRQAQKMEAIGRLAGGVAHDFNNLLTAIRGYTELLLTSLAADDPRREDADEILKASDRAAGLTRQLLAFSRKGAVTPRVLALDRVLPNVEQMLRRLIGEDITLASDIAPGVWSIKADPGQMDQVLLNLAVNARDAMPSGGTLRIALSNVIVGDPNPAAGGSSLGGQSLAGQSLAEQSLVGQSVVRHDPSVVGQGFSPAMTTPHSVLAPGAYVRISMTDTGTGMTDETVQRIFEPFFTTKGEGRGTGLGLATVYGIVQQAGGTIDVVTAVGKGSTFHLFLPRCDESPTPEEPSARHVASHQPRPTETVLLVEDDHRVNTLVANVLRQSGYTVLAAVHGEEALALSREHSGPIHMLLTDVVMPGMNGRELSEVVAVERPDTRILFMSGYPDDAIVRQGIQTASVQFLQKPFSMDVLIAKMRAAFVS